jgi:hypothetical protein
MSGDNDTKSVYTGAELSNNSAKRFDNRAEYFDEEKMSGYNDAKSVYIGVEQFDDHAKQFGEKEMPKAARKWLFT